MQLKVLLIAFFSVFSTTIYSQKNTYVINLEKFPKIDTLSFNITEIIDDRLIKTNIGFAQKGAFNKKVIAVLPDSLKNYLEPIVTEMVVSKDENRNFIMLVKDLVVFEQTKATSETGYCRAQIEFLENKNNQLYSYATTFAEVENKGLDVTSGHSKRIIKAIVQCLGKFNALDPSSITPRKYVPNERIEYDFKSVPKKGVYSSFFEMSRNNPDTLSDYSLKKRGSKRSEKYFLIDSNDKIIKKRNMAISDGENLYIHASNYSYSSHYVKSKHLGRYIYFEDSYSDPVAAAAFGAAFGLVGVIAGSSIKNKHGIILDTETGLVKVLNEKLIKQLLADNKSLYLKYKKSSRDLKMKELVIIQLNKSALNN